MRPGRPAKCFTALTALAGLLLSPLPAQAETAVGASFADMVLLGCIPATMTGTTIATYAKSAGLRQDPRLTSDLQKAVADTEVFVLPHTQTIIAWSPSTGCTVMSYGPVAPAMIQQITSMMAGDGAPFKSSPPTRKQNSDGTVATVQDFTGTIRDRTYAAMLTLNPEAQRGAKATFFIGQRAPAKR